MNKNQWSDRPLPRTSRQRSMPERRPTRQNHTTFSLPAKDQKALPLNSTLATTMQETFVFQQFTKE